MRSLWRILALQWLGGDGSEALTADLAILEGVYLKSSENAVLRHQDGGSPWRVISVRQSENPAPPRRGDRVIELAQTNLRR